MRSIIRGVATLATAVALAACSGAATSAPTTAGTQAPPGSQAPAATTGGTAVCADSTGTTTVDATVGNFQWSQPISAKVGDVITWTNSDAAAHAVGLDDGSCKMSGTIPGGGGKASLVFSVAGTYPFHCTVHPTMKGTITIS